MKAPMSVPIEDECSLALTFTHPLKIGQILCTLQFCIYLLSLSNLHPQTDVQQKAIP